MNGAAVSDYFDNLLPDSDAIRKRLQAKFKSTNTSAFSLLYAVGRDCVGAVQLLPPAVMPTGFDTIETVALNHAEVERILQQTVAPANPMLQHPEDALRLSIAGTQEKTALTWRQKRWCRPLGATPTTHIFKLPSGLVGNRRADVRSSVENERLCSQILDAYGMPVARCEIAVFGQTKALVVERFDRTMARAGTHWLRLPQEDLCQATGTPAAQKYETDGGPGMLRIATLLANSSNRNADIETLLKAQIIFWMLRATDGHAKNFSLFLLSNHRYRLTPLYDVLSAWPVIGDGPDRIPAQQVRLAMAWRGKNAHYHADGVLRRHLVTTAIKCGYAEDPQHLIHKLTTQTSGVIDVVSSKLPRDFPPVLARPIFDGLLVSAQRLASREAGS